MTTTPLDEQRIREMRAAIPDGPWKWKQAYQMGQHQYHWELSNPESDAEGKTIDASLVLLHDAPEWFHRPCATLPMWEFIARSPEMIDFLLAEVERLRKELNGIIE